MGPQCENMFFSKQSLEAEGENTIPKEIDAVPPLCKYHYHVVYNTYKPTQMYCPTCGTRLRRFFCLCALMFCTNDRCCGGWFHTYRLGVCSSADTSIQYRVTERERKGVQSECSSQSFLLTTLTSCIVILMFFCGDQKRNESGMEPQYSWFDQSTCRQSY